MNYVRTALLLAALTGLFLAVGYLLGGASGAGRSRSAPCSRSSPRAASTRSCGHASAYPFPRATGSLQRKSPQPAPSLLSPLGQGEKIEERSHLLCRALIPSQ